MSDDPILAALARLETSQAHLTRVVDRLETKVDRVTDDMQDVKLRISMMENHLGSMDETIARQSVTAGANSTRIDRLEARVILIEKRLELRDDP